MDRTISMLKSLISAWFPILTILFILSEKTSRLGGCFCYLGESFMMRPSGWARYSGPPVTEAGTIISALGH
jgi:hypothetical protein